MLSWIGAREQFFESFVISLVISLFMAIMWKRHTEDLTVQIALAEDGGESEKFAWVPHQRQRDETRRHFQPPSVSVVRRPA